MARTDVIIPAYNAEAYVSQAIQSVLNQTDRDFRCLVSVDVSDDQTAAICRSFQDQPNVEVFIQEKRLGWVANVNFLLDRVEAPYFATVFHDDFVSENYLQILHTLFEQHRNCVAVGSAVQHVGDARTIVTLEPVSGTQFERLKAILGPASNFYSLKSLHRSKVLSNGNRLRESADRGFAADMPFLMRVAAQGELVATDEPVYFKSIRTGSVTGSFRRWGPAERLVNISAIRAEVLSDIAKLDLSDAEFHELVTMLVLPGAARLHQVSVDEMPAHFATIQTKMSAMIIANLLGRKITETNANTAAYLNALLSGWSSQLVKHGQNEAGETMIQLSQMCVPTEK